MNLSHLNSDIQSLIKITKVDGLPYPSTFCFPDYYIHLFLKNRGLSKIIVGNYLILWNHVYLLRTCLACTPSTLAQYRHWIYNNKNETAVNTITHKYLLPLICLCYIHCNSHAYGEQDIRTGRCVCLYG